MTPLKHTTHATRWLDSGSLRRLAVVGVTAPLIALSGCTSSTPDTAGTASAPSVSSTSGPSAPAATTAASAAPGATSTPAAPDTSTPATPEPTRTDTALDLVLKDAQLGHSVTVTKLARNIPWPDDAPVGEAAFELVGVEVTVVAGERFSAAVEPSMFTLQAGSSGVSPATTEFGNKFGTPLAGAKRGETKEGWLFFKVPRGSTTPFTLYLNRPAYTVSTTGQSFPATRTGVKVVG